VGDDELAQTQVAAIEIVDYKGKQKNLVLYFGSAASVATITTALQDIETTLDPVIDGVIVGHYIEVRPALAAGLKTTAGTNAVQEGASISWHLNETTRSYNMFLPSAKDSLFVGETFDYEDALVQALQTDLAASLTPEGTALVDIFRGKYGVRK